jgi:hypothetical protein
MNDESAIMCVMIGRNKYYYCYYYYYYYKHLNLQEKLWCKLKIWDFYLASENLMTEFKIEHVFQCVLEICESTVASFS